ncbi:MAG: hypothetical protein WCW44_01765 [archaeon]|jgi:hypothetical protein
MGMRAAAKRVGLRGIELTAKKEKKGIGSKVHGGDHAMAVAKTAYMLAYRKALAEGASIPEAKRSASMAFAAGGQHDMTRKATELKPHGNTAKRAFLTLAKRYPSVYEFNAAEKEAIADAIELHELAYEELKAKVAGKTREARVAAEAVQIADKVFEASGVRVIERRAFFVGKERLMPGKDLHYLKEIYGEKAPLCAVAMESCMRLRGINYLPDVEKAMQPIAAPLHAVQEKFYLGLLHEIGFKNESQLLEEMKRIKFPKLDKMGAKIEKTIAIEAPRVARLNISSDTAKSAAETVMHFVQSKSPTEALATFRPQGQQAKEWLKGMQGYRQGNFGYLKQLSRQLRQAFA